MFTKNKGKKNVALDRYVIKSSTQILPLAQSQHNKAVVVFHVVSFCAFVRLCRRLVKKKKKPLNSSDKIFGFPLFFFVHQKPHKP